MLPLQDREVVKKFFGSLTLLLPNFLYVMGAPFIGSARTAIAGSVELPVIFIVGLLAFSEPITLLQSVAGFLVVIAIWKTRAKPSKNLEASEEVEGKKMPLLLSLESSTLIPSRLVDWVLILGISILTLLLPSLLYVIAIPIIGSTRSAIIGGIELPIVFVLGWIAFGEEITLVQCVAGVLVLSAIWMTSIKPSEKVLQEVEIKKMMPPTSVKTSVENIKSEA